MYPFVSVTIDVEDWYHIPAVSGSTFSTYKDTADFFRRWKGRYDYLTNSTRRMLNLLSEFGIRGTFFVVAEIIHRYPGLVENIAREGHEIACHGYDHRCYLEPRTGFPRFSRRFFRNKIRLAKELLEAATGQPILGFRAPSAYISGWMLDVLEELHFDYDSSVSVNSLYNKTDSDLRGVGRTPYFPQRKGLEPGPPRGILEIPWPYYKLGPFALPCAGGPFLRFLGSRFILGGLRQSLQSGSAILYAHSIDISRDKFPSSFSIKRPFYWLIQGKQVEDRIRYILSKLDVEYITMSETSKRWKCILRNNSA